MTKPIPVFSFVFAAYAAISATSRQYAVAAVNEDVRTRDPFLTAWRSRAARGASFFAKVGVLAVAGDLKLATRAAGEICEELWLSEIAETKLGFIGTAIEFDRTPSHVAAGQRVCFHLINVLDWRKLDPAVRPAAAHCWTTGKQDPREMLARLCETVSK